MSLFGHLEKMSVNELEVLLVLLLKVAEMVDICNEAQVSNVIKGDVDPMVAIVVGLNDEHVVVINEGALLVKCRCRIEGLGVDGFIGCVGVGTSQDDRVGCVGK